MLLRAAGFFLPGEGALGPSEFPTPMAPSSAPGLLVAPAAGVFGAAISSCAGWPSLVSAPATSRSSLAAAEGRSIGYQAKHCRASCCKSRSSLRDFGSSNALPAQLKQQLLLPVSLANKCYQVAAPKLLPATAGSLGTWPGWGRLEFCTKPVQAPLDVGGETFFRWGSATSA